MLRKIIIGGFVLLVAASYGYRTMTSPQWTTVTSTFAKAERPYGGGAFRLRSDEMMTLRLVGPEITFKPAEQLKDPQVAEPTEAWMNDSNERLNRSTVSFLRGTLRAGMTRFFHQPAQDAAWWYSKDWTTFYVATDWMDYKRAEPKNGLSPHIAKLWRSGDGGKTWIQLKWPQDRNINSLFFLDSQRGYAIGWGPHIWRTADGGQSWEEIALPPTAANANQPRKTFDAADLGPDGVLRVAYYTRMLGTVRSSSVVYRLSWDATQFEQDAVLPDQVIVQLGTTDGAPGRAYSLYALSRLGPPRDWDAADDNGHRTGAISTWTSHGRSNIVQLHTFDPRYTLDGLSVGTKGVLLVYATDASRRGAPHDFTFYSRDAGRSWNDMDDGIGQGGWFDPETNTQYALYAYTLKKRQF